MSLSPVSKMNKSSCKFKASIAPKIFSVGEWSPPKQSTITLIIIKTS